MGIHELPKSCPVTGNSSSIVNSLGVMKLSVNVLRLLIISMPHVTLFPYPIQPASQLLLHNNQHTHVHSCRGSSMARQYGKQLAIWQAVTLTVIRSSRQMQPNFTLRGFAPVFDSRNSPCAYMTADIEDLYHQAVGLHRSGQLQQAEVCYRQVLLSDPGNADCLHQLGVLLIQQNGRKQYSEAVQLVRRAIQLAPSNAKYRRSLGVIHEAAEQWAAAADAYERAIEKRPTDVQACMDLGRVLKRLRRPAAAAEAYKAVIKLQPDHTTAHYKLASLLKQLGQHQAAAEQFRQHLQLVPGHTSASFWLAALTGQQQDACPSSLVSKMFDQYADHFDQHLVDKLNYQTPTALMDCVLEVASNSRSTSSNGNSNSSSGGTRDGDARLWPRCIDLGCGTGLMGPLLRPHVSGQLAGVDLSGGMVERARQRGCYDELAVAELVAHLQAVKQDGLTAFDLFVAADVFVYIGDLQPVLKAAADIASDRALFAFSTEMLGPSPPERRQSATETAAAPSEGNHTKSSPQQPCSRADAQVEACVADYVLQTTGRYAHSAGYLRQVALASGWSRILLLKEAVIRMNAGHPIRGNLCVLQR